MTSHLMRYVFVIAISCSFSLNAQQSLSDTGKQPEPHLEYHPIYDYNSKQLSSVDSIPEFESKNQKLKITGVIYESDGVTPARDVILYIEQADENGDFDLKKINDKRYVYHRGWIKTDATGRYTFYTFVPGGDRRYNQLQQLFPTIRTPSKSAYNLESFLFDSDPLLTRMCRKKLIKKGDVSRILAPLKQGDFLVVQKNIILDTDALVSN